MRSARRQAPGAMASSRRRQEAGQAGDRIASVGLSGREIAGRAGITEQGEYHPTVARRPADHFRNVLRIVSGMSKEVCRRNWRATVDEDGHYSFAVPL